MLVHEVMSTGVVIVKKAGMIRSAVMKMMHRHCGSLPVVEADNQLVGVVTLRDISDINRGLFIEKGPKIY
jgi:CBS domain-containing protein